MSSEYRNKGVGASLIEHLIKEATKKKNVKIMIAEVASDNVASQNLLKKYKFKEFGNITNGFKRKDHSFIHLLYFSRYL